MASALERIETRTRAPQARTAGSAQRLRPRCRRRFLEFYPGGFQDADYLALERGYKWQAHEQWLQVLDRPRFAKLLREQAFATIAAHAVRIESRTNLLFSFEKMALRDAVREPDGARLFAEGLYEWLHGRGTLQRRFERWRDVVAQLPRRQTRVLTWPVVTVFGFIAQPGTHLFVKPMVTRQAARRYGFPYQYESRPSWDSYWSALEFAAAVRRDLRDLRPRDMIDLQGYIWVQGSQEYD